MNKIDALASELQKTITEKDKNKKSPYDTEAVVTRVDSDVVWVKIPGGVDETPAQRTVDAKPGDNVQVRVSGGSAFLVGNGTNPPTDDTVAYKAIGRADDANENARVAGVAADAAIESANQANEKAIEATEFATQAKTQAGEATEAANEAKSQASAATTAANQAKTQAAEAETAANEAKTSAAEATTAANEAKTQASEATTAANQAKDDAAKANTAANGAITSLGIVQGVVDGLSVDMDEMQTHVAMMDAVVDPDSGKTLVPAGLHVVPTSNGYFVVLSNDGMYVYDNESDLVATFGENIKFDSIRPQRIGGDDAYIEYYDSDNDGKADSLRIVGANISSSTGIPTKVSELQNDSGYTTKTYVDDAVGDTATDLANYILSNDKAIDDLERQIDGAIDTWYYAVDPTTSNEPAKDWTTEALKESHLRDLYFNTSNGHTWRWAKDGSTYKWIQIEDADAIKALADAAKAQTTADVKRRVFVSQPTPPYDVGDLWVGGSNGDIKKCKTPKTESQSYAAADWELASKYTDDSALNTFKTTTYATDLQQTNEAINLRATKTEVSEAIDDEIEAAKAEIKVTTDGISSEVAKKVGASEIISKINQSAETVQIEAEKIEFKGSVVFNAIKSQTDAAYDTKGSASEASKIATSYITDIDSKNGITIKAVNGTTSGSNTDTQNYIKLNADGLDIYKGGKSVAMYGDTARLGEATSARLTLGPEGLGLYDTNSVRYFNIESSVGATNTYVDRKITDVSGGIGAVTTDLSSDASVADIWSNLATGAEFFIRIAWFYYNSSGACIATKESGDSFKKGTTKTSNSYVKYTKPNTLAFTASYPSVSGASTVMRMAHLEVEYSLFGPVYQFCNNPTSSNGAYCFMTGNGVQTNYDYQTAVGRYNDPDFVDDGPEDYRGLFFVGGGASDAYRKNAMVVTHSDDPDGYGSDILIGLETDICNNDIDIAGYLSDLGWDLEVLVDK